MLQQGNATFPQAAPTETEEHTKSSLGISIFNLK